MNASIHLETAILFLFLVIVLWAQAERAGVPGYYSPNPRRQIFALSIVFVLLSVGLGSILYKVSPLFGIALAAGFTLSLIHPANALCFLVHMLFLRPWEIPTTNPLLLALPRLLVVACFVSWLLYQGESGKPTPRTLRVSLILQGFSVWLFLTTFGAAGRAAVQLDWFNTFFKSVVVFALCLFFLEDERGVLEFKRTLVLSIFGLMILSFYRFFFAPPNALSGGRLSSFGLSGNSNDLAAVVIIALPLALMPAFRSQTTAARRLGGILFSGISLAAIWYTQSRGAMLALCAQVFALGALFRDRGRGLRMLFMAGVLGLGYVLVIKAIPRSTDEMAQSQENRLTYWKAAVQMTLHNPILGVGFDQYVANYNSYGASRRDAGDVQTAHSSWFLAFAESGIPGGVLFIAFFLSVLATAWRNRRQWPEQLYALLGYGVAMSFLSHTYEMYLYVLAGLIMASNSLKERADCAF